MFIGHTGVESANMVVTDSAALSPSRLQACLKAISVSDIKVRAGVACSSFRVVDEEVLQDGNGSLQKH
jgi:hypothetical protein